MNCFCTSSPALLRGPYRSVLLSTCTCLSVYMFVHVYMEVYVYRIIRPSSPLEHRETQISMYMYVCILVGYMHCTEGKMGMCYM